MSKNNKVKKTCLGALILREAWQVLLFAKIIKKALISWLSA